MKPKRRESPRGPRTVWLVALAVALVTGAVFSGALSAEFVKWDDDINITRNVHIQGLGREQLAWMFTDMQQALRYKPLSWLSWAAIHAVSGLNPAGYHLANLLFHAINAGLVFLLIHRLLARDPEQGGGDRGRAAVLCAALGALLWAWHPMRVEPVAWASGLPYCQSVCFALLSALCYWQAGGPDGTRRLKRGWYWASVGAFAVALFTYPIVLTFFLGLVALDLHLWRRNAGGPWNWRSPAMRTFLWRKAPFVIVAALLLAVALYARSRATGPWPKAPSLAEFSLAHRVMQACYVWAWYLWKALLPLDLSPVYTRLVSFSPGGGPFVWALAGLLAMTGLLVWQRRRWPGALLLWLAYLALLIPVLGLTEHPHYANDRYSLLAHVVGAAAVATGLMRLCEQRARCGGWLLAACAVAVACAVLSVRQTLAWRNSETLFRHMVRTLGHDPYRAEILWRLGEVLALRGQTAAAAAAYEEALRTAPKSASAHNGMGELLAQQGRWREALDCFSRALDCQPGFLRALNNIAWTLATADDATVRNGGLALGTAQALNERSGIHNAQFLETLAAAYAETGQFDQAIATAERIPAMAKQTGEHEVAARNEKLIQLYRAGQPYRQPGKVE